MAFKLTEDRKAQIAEMADSIRRENKLTIPLDSIMLAEKLGFKILYEPMADPTITGTIRVDPVQNSRTITINIAAADIESARFIVAHEIGHVVLENSDDGSLDAANGSDSEQNEREAAAEYFARCLMMPLDAMRIAVKKLYEAGIRLGSKEYIPPISRVFVVPEQKAAARLLETGYLYGV
ncbi:MAG: ImmA/IrrE family metallo-endopeptidase [Firmicutes bacterium]|nr:ImmA/IrrE family metallo-endopeptidase [Bacillota bacterium]